MRRGTVTVVVVAVAVAASIATPSSAAAALPDISYTLTGTAGANGWFLSALTVSWAVNFQGTPVSSSGCEAAIAITNDTAGTTRTCTATNGDGTISATTRVIQIDTVPPVVTGAAPARPPDVAGFYRSAVNVAWSGTDDMSGIDGCTSVTYAGPDGPASPVGVCRDKAGNTSAPRPFPLTYDATPPALTGVTAAASDALTTVAWSAGADAQQVTISRSPGVGRASASIVYQGRSTKFVDTGLSNGVRYLYRVSATDAAGNASTASATARPESHLLGPRPGARMARPPLLRWKRVAHARYYNVQLFRGGRKIQTAWPRHPRLRLHRTWRFHGHRQRMRAGTYRWYVWPGYGRRSRRNYGRLLGIRTFTISRPGAR
jgi:hypothetical protein